MRPKPLAPRVRRCLTVAAACAVAGAAAAAPPAPVIPDPADAAATVPPAPYAGALPPSARGYLGATDAPRLPWTGLFRADGSFVPDAPPGGASADVSAAPGAGMATHATHAAHAAPGAAAPPPAGDASGVIRAVDAAQGKVTLKHGPIARLDMPGMTMVFRVKEASLLEGFQKGDDVDFDVELDGTTFYVTALRKREAPR